MLKIPKPYHPEQYSSLGDYEFHDDQLELAGLFDFPFEVWTVFDDVFSFGLSEIIASMWTFNQGLLSADIINSRLMKYPIDKVWHANHLISLVGEELIESFCKSIHILDRMKVDSDRQN